MTPTTYRKIFLAAGLAAVLGTAATPALAHGPAQQDYGWHYGWHMGPGMMGYGCPMMSGYGMQGPGMMGPGMMGQGMMMPPGYGMMRPGYDQDDMPMIGPRGQGMGQGMGPGMMQQQQRAELSTDDVKRMLERQLAWQGNPHLKLGKVEAKDDDTIVAEVVTQDDSLVERYEVDRHSGALRVVR